MILNILIFLGVNGMVDEDLSINSINITDYDFFDFGCSNGKSLFYGVNKFGGKRGVGIDIDPNKVKQARYNLDKKDVSSIHTVVCEDITSLPEIKDKVRFTTCIHFLEHLFGCSYAEKVLESAINVSEEFIFVLQPFADKDSELFKLGFKTYYSDWTGHTNLMSSYDFYKICRNFYYDNKIKNFIIFATDPIYDSSSEFIHPIDSSFNQHSYDKDIHKPKRDDVKFNDLFKDIGVLILLDDNVNPYALLENINREIKIIFDSDEMNKDEVKDISISDCDFVDVGTGNGASLRFGMQKFGGKVGLGIDFADDFVEKLEPKLGNITKGFSYHKLLCEDILKLNSASPEFFKQFKFTSCINTVEELNSVDELELMIRKFSDLSTDFAFISHVNNDYDDYLASKGFETHHKHSNRNYLLLSSDDYINLLTKLKYEGIVVDFVIFRRNRILDSSHNSLYAIGGEKSGVVSLEDVFSNIDVFLLFKNSLDVNDISKRLVGEKELIYSSIE